MTREERIAEIRRRQPVEELERKWNKAQGRWSNQFWSAEWLDLCDVRAKKIAANFRNMRIHYDCDV